MELYILVGNNMDKTKNVILLIPNVYKVIEMFVRLRLSTNYTV